VSERDDGCHVKIEKKRVLIVVQVAREMVFRHAYISQVTDHELKLAE
jgi:hypothetical protein